MNDRLRSSEKVLKFVGPSELPRFYRFGPFLLSPRDQQLIRDGKAIRLTPKEAELLLLLVQNHGRLLTREVLMSTLWPDTFVEDGTLTQHIFHLRKILEDDSIETVPRRGYQFNAAVTASYEEDEQPPPSSRAKRRGMVAAIALVAAAIGLFTLHRLRAHEQLSMLESVAVLPFATVPPEESRSYLGLSLTDALITRLGHATDLRVSPTLAVQRFPAGSDGLNAGQQLGVQAVVSGIVQESANRIRVTVQIVRVADQTRLWSHTFDSEKDDLFALQDRISENLIGVFGSKPGAPRPAFPPLDPKEYEAYLKGRYYWNRRTLTDFHKAAEQFEAVIASEPRYAPAWAGLANCYNFLHRVAEAKRAARRALELDSELAEAHAALANASLFHDHDWKGAQREFRRSIALNPSYATAHQWYAFYFAGRGEFDEALQEIERARTLDPLSLIIMTDVGKILFYARRYEEAIAQYRQALAMDPHFAQAYFDLGDAYLHTGRHTEALEAIETATRYSDRADLMLAKAHARAGKRDQAVRMFERANDPSAGNPLYMAKLFAALGQNDRALESLDESYRQRQGELVMLQVDPNFDPLRGDPRFTEFLNRTGLRGTSSQQSAVSSQ